MSTSHTSSASTSYVSTKPWFLTFSEETRDVFVWKSGIRLQLKEGESAGGVRSVSVRSIKDRTITVSVDVSTSPLLPFMYFIVVNPVERAHNNDSQVK